jgi:hypothetical protein
MKLLIAAILTAYLPIAALAQTPAKPAANAAKPAAKPAAKSNQPVAVKKAPATNRRQAIEEATPLEEPDPTIKLSEADLAVAKRVHVGEIACELGAKVSIKAMRRDGFFLVQHRLTRFVMHPVDSRTGAIRLEDPVRGAMWLQLGNKSMLLNQKAGQRLADECASPDQMIYARDMKPVNLLEPAPVARPAAPAAQTRTGPAASTLPAAAPAEAAPAPAAPAVPAATAAPAPAH